MSSSAEQLPDHPPTAHVPVEELARLQGVGPVISVDDLAEPDLFESDDELDAFLADLHDSRRAGVA